MSGHVAWHTSSMTERVSRRQVLAYRAAAHGLDRQLSDPLALGVLDIGVQEGRGSALLALAARLADPPVELDPDGPLVLLWAARGAPHVQRRADLPALASALWPDTEADALTRLSSERGALKKAGITGLAAYTAVTEAVRAVVTGPMPKGEVSAGVTARLPEVYSYECRSCKSRHVYGNVFQLVGLPAGVYHRVASPNLTLAPLPDRSPIPAKSAGTADFLRAYLRLHGPATLGDAAGYLGTSQANARPAWPDGLVEVDLDGRTTWLPEESLAGLRAAGRPRGVRLLPPLDPWLQARDRDLIVPDPARQKEVWKILGNPGAIWADGEVAGVWRAKTAGKTLQVTVELFDQVSTKDIEAEAGRMAELRGLADAKVV